MFKFFILAVAVTLITIALCFNSVLFRETNDLISTINSGSPVSSLQPRRLETESANYGNIEASVHQSAINGQLGHRRDRLASSDGSFERKRTHDQSRSDAKSSSLLKRLKHLKKQLTQALRAPIAGVPVATSPTLARGITALAAAALNTRAPADDASAGPWEFPGEPGLYSSLKRSLGQVGGPARHPHFPRCEHMFRAPPQFVHRRIGTLPGALAMCQRTFSAREAERHVPSIRTRLRISFAPHFRQSALCVCARAARCLVHARARGTSNHALVGARTRTRTHPAAPSCAAKGAWRAPPPAAENHSLRIALPAGYGGGGAAAGRPGPLHMRLAASSKPLKPMTG